MAETTLKIAGMRCHHCVMDVRKALSKLDGITEAEVENLIDRLGYSVQK